MNLGKVRHVTGPTYIHFLVLRILLRVEKMCTILKYLFSVLFFLYFAFTISCDATFNVVHLFLTGVGALRIVLYGHPLAFLLKVELLHNWIMRNILEI